jgi:hypothetical protein
MVNFKNFVLLKLLKMSFFDHEIKAVLIQQKIDSTLMNLDQ